MASNAPSSPVRTSAASRVSSSRSYRPEAGRAPMPSRTPQRGIYSHPPASVDIAKPFGDDRPDPGDRRWRRADGGRARRRPRRPQSRSNPGATTSDLARHAEHGRRYRDRHVHPPRSGLPPRVGERAGGVHLRLPGAGRRVCDDLNTDDRRRAQTDQDHPQAAERRRPRSPSATPCSTASDRRSRAPATRSRRSRRWRRRRTFGARPQGGGGVETQPHPAPDLRRAARPRRDAPPARGGARVPL